MPALAFRAWSCLYSSQRLIHQNPPHIYSQITAPTDTTPAVPLCSHQKVRRPCLVFCFCFHFFGNDILMEGMRNVLNSTTGPVFTINGLNSCGRGDRVLNKNQQPPFQRSSGWAEPSPHLPQSHHSLTTLLLAYFKSQTESTLEAELALLFVCMTLWTGMAVVVDT